MGSCSVFPCPLEKVGTFKCCFECDKQKECEKSCTHNPALVEAKDVCWCYTDEGRT